MRTVYSIQFQKGDKKLRPNDGAINIEEINLEKGGLIPLVGDYIEFDENNDNKIYKVIDRLFSMKYINKSNEIIWSIFVNIKVKEVESNYREKLIKE